MSSISQPSDRSGDLISQIDKALSAAMCRYADVSAWVSAHPDRAEWADGYWKLDRDAGQRIRIRVIQISAIADYLHGEGLLTAHHVADLLGQLITSDMALDEIYDCEMRRRAA